MRRQYSRSQSVESKQVGSIPEVATALLRYTGPYPPGAPLPRC